MKLEPKHWAVMAGLLTGLATQLLSAQHGWSDLATPGFVAGLLIQLASAITAIFVGAPGATAALEKANKNTDLANDSVRAALSAPPLDLGKVDPKRFISTGIVLLALVLGAATLPACAVTRPPPGTYTEAGLKAFDADQLLKDLTALSSTAINLNAEKGKLHLKDRDTALIRDFTLSAGAGLVAYGQGQGTLAVVVTAFRELTAKLSAEAVLNDSLRFIFALVADNINRLGTP